MPLPVPRPVRPWSPLQLDVLRCLAEGLDTDEIAARCGIAPVTLHGWIRNIASMLPDEAPCVQKLSSRERVHLYAVALFFGQEADVVA